MARLRSTRALAKRIDLTYFKRLHPFRKWKRNLSILAALLAAAWPVWAAIDGDQTPYSGGPVSSRHAMFGARCSVCHTGTWGERYLDPKRWQQKMDEACLDCHDGPIHHTTQTDFIGGWSASRCSDCHVEHYGRPHLADITSAHCTQCHADLKRLGDEAHDRRCLAGPGHAVARNVRDFEFSHPPFAAEAAKAKDPTRLKFNHKVHLNPDTEEKQKVLQRDLERLKDRREIVGVGPGRRQLECAYCHAADGERRYMLPVNYENHCRDCHALELKAAGDDRPPRVPHEAPSIVRHFLRSAFAGKLPNEDALAEKVSDTEINLFTADAVSCLKCHDVELGDEFPAHPPVVHPTGVNAAGDGAPRRWFVHGLFNHKVHRELTCAACHGNANASELTSDLLMPVKSICGNCHGSKGGASTACATCHLYHNQSLGRGMEGHLKIGDVRK